MSMYNPNVSIPKTLVKFLVKWAAEHEFEGEARRDTARRVRHRDFARAAADRRRAARSCRRPKTTIGPYELRRFLPLPLPPLGARRREDPLPGRARRRSRRPTRRPNCGSGCRVFLQRFFANQFKRSCLPDGPKVGTVALSPRGDWRMPSDARRECG